MKRVSLSVLLALIISISLICPLYSSAEGIEPGSSESFIYWTASTLDYIDGVLGSGNIAEWGVATIGYGLDMRSMLVAYSNWFDNQDFDTSPLQWRSAVGYFSVFDPIGQTTSYHYAYATGCLNPPDIDLNLLSGSSYCSFPFGTVSLPSSGKLPSIIPFSGSNNQYNFTFQGLASSNFCDFSGTNPFSGISFIGTYYNINKGTSYVSLNCSTRTPSGLSAIYFHSGMSLIDLYGTIRDKYPDADFDQFPELTPPVNDVDFNQEPTEPETHPDGCCCCNCVVQFSTINYDFPEYSTENPDFVIPENLPLETFPSIENPEIPSSVIEKASAATSFWFNVFDSVFEILDIRWLIALVLFLGLFFYILVR